LREQKDATVPERPKSQGPGTRLNNSFFFTQYVTGGQKKNSLRDEDPREALLRMDAVAKADPLFTGNAYKDSQPKPVLTTMTFEEEQEEFKKRQKQQLN
jgi:WD repeat-containing protein 70